jgi:ATP-dependent Lon protease
MAAFVALLAILSRPLGGSGGGEEDRGEDKRNRNYPVLPLRDIVVFPHMIVPLFVGREKSVRRWKSAMAADKQIFLVSQLDPAEDDPDRDALYDLGVVATVLQLLKLPDGTVKVLVEGKQRATLRRCARMARTEPPRSSGRPRSPRASRSRR